MTEQQYRFVVTCAKGVAPFLLQEIQTLGYRASEISPAAVELHGDISTVYRLNLWLRCAHRVLLSIADGVAATAGDLYRWAVQLPWEEHLSHSTTFTVTASVKNETIRNSLYACQKLKDAIADRLRNQTGKRPNSDGRRQGSVIFLYWRGTQVSVLLDTSGVPLSKRGYRRVTSHAPLSEAVAAAILYAAKWNDSEPLIAPMCGSGTFAIEAALMSRNIPPAIFRRDFAFKHWRLHQIERWDDVLENARALAVEKSVVIHACDHDPTALNAAAANALSAAVYDSISFFQCDFRSMPLPEAPATIIVNPPYGIRLGYEHDIHLLHKQLGDWFKNSCSGMRGFVLTTPANAKHIGLRPRRRLIFFNADIECRLLEYELYSGRLPSLAAHELG